MGASKMVDIYLKTGYREQDGIFQSRPVYILKGSKGEYGR
jgi:hypothetical protein